MRAPTLSRCGCPGGCVVITFGYVTVHLSRDVFLRFSRSVMVMAAHIDAEEGSRASA